MDLSPLWQSHWIIIVHALAALLAVVLGAVQLAMPKGTPIHRGLGRFWVGLVMAVALTSFGIHEFRMLGPFSLIHLLSILTLYTLWEGISAVRNGKIELHKNSMLTLYCLALLLTGAFTLLPGRVFHRVFFDA